MYLVRKARYLPFCANREEIVEEGEAKHFSLVPPDELGAFGDAREENIHRRLERNTDRLGVHNYFRAVSKRRRRSGSRRRRKSKRRLGTGRREGRGGGAERTTLESGARAVGDGNIQRSAAACHARCIYRNGANGV